MAQRRLAMTLWARPPVPFTRSPAHQVRLDAARAVMAVRLAQAPAGKRPKKGKGRPSAKAIKMQRPELPNLSDVLQPVPEHMSAQALSDVMVDTGFKYANMSPAMLARSRVFLLSRYGVTSVGEKDGSAAADHSQQSNDTSPAEGEKQASQLSPLASPLAKRRLQVSEAFEALQQQETQRLSSSPDETLPPHVEAQVIHLVDAACAAGNLEVVVNGIELMLLWGLRPPPVLLARALFAYSSFAGDHAVIAAYDWFKAEELSLDADCYALVFSSLARLLKDDYNYASLEAASTAWQKSKLPVSPSMFNDLASLTLEEAGFEGEHDWSYRRIRVFASMLQEPRGVPVRQSTRLLEAMQAAFTERVLAQLLVNHDEMLEMCEQRFANPDGNWELVEEEASDDFPIDEQAEREVSGQDDVAGLNLDDLNLEDLVKGLTDEGESDEKQSKLDSSSSEETEEQRKQRVARRKKRSKTTGDA